MQEIKIEKQNLIKLSKEEQYNGIVAFQFVKITYSFYGRIMEKMYDTKIMEDGTQLVIDGDGFIPGGFEIKQ